MLDCSPTSSPDLIRDDDSGGPSGGPTDGTVGTTEIRTYRDRQVKLNEAWGDKGCGNTDHNNSKYGDKSHGSVTVAMTT